MAYPAAVSVFEPSRRRHLCGFTLVELVVTLAIFGIAGAAIFGSMSFALGKQSDSLWRAKTEILARSYLDQIMIRKFDELTPEGGVPRCGPCSSPADFDDGESRANFDDVDDFNGLREIPPLDEDGQPIEVFAGFQVEVSVAYLDAAQQLAFGLADSQHAKVVSVIVTPPGGSSQVFSAVRANY